MRLLEYKIILGLLGCIILFCCFRCYIIPFWRERKNIIRIKPEESIIMVNPMRIKQEKIMRMI